MNEEFRRQYPFHAATMKKQEYTPANRLAIPSQRLICPARFDFMAKLIFLDSQNKKFSARRGIEIYQKHLLAFSGGKIREPGNPAKNSLEKYIHTFRSIYASVQKMPKEEACFCSLPLPVTRSFMAIDGSHRICSAIDTGHPLFVYYLKNYELPRCYDYRFFRRRFLEESILLEMAIKYNSEKSLVLFKASLFKGCPKKTLASLEKRLCQSRAIVSLFQNRNTLFVLIDPDYAVPDRIQAILEKTLPKAQTRVYSNKDTIEDQLRRLLPHFLKKEKKPSPFRYIKRTALYSIITIKARIKELILYPLLSK